MTSEIPTSTDPLDATHAGPEARLSPAVIVADPPGLAVTASISAAPWQRSR